MTKGRGNFQGWDDAQDERLKRLWSHHGGSIVAIADTMGRTPGSIDGRSRKLNLQFHALSNPAPIKAGSPADVHGRTRFHSSVVHAPQSGLLKPGENQRKLGAKVLKGAWKGMPIYSLTLEERATCPRSCLQWLDCYGNHMGRAVRFRHGADLEAQLYIDLLELDRKHPAGFVVRLHILGDFYSRQYVDFWRAALDDFPSLRIFGYTARLPADPIGEAITRLRDARWNRFAIRTSGGEAGPRTMVVKHPGTIKTETGLWAEGAITCPAQTGATSHCGACALCWAPAAKDRPIAFVAH